jgi:hypothetical protein
MPTNRVLQVFRMIAGENELLDQDELVRAHDGDFKGEFLAVYWACIAPAYGPCAQCAVWRSV